MIGPSDDTIKSLTAEQHGRSAAAWGLRISLAAMCVGYAAAWAAPWSYVIGGLGAAILIWPYPLFCLVVSGLMISVVVEKMSHEPFGVFEALEPAAHGARYLGPIALALLWARSSGPAGRSVLEWILRLAAAGTFAGHGVEALMQKSSFIALIAGTFTHIGVEIDPVTSGLALKIIGAVDIVVAALVLVAPWRPVVAWMAFWGTIAAFSRMTAHGWTWWHETAIRLPNGGVPLALLCLWWKRTGDEAD